jgi:hypothetical protein
MMAINFYRVLFHVIDASGKPLPAFGTHTETIAAASGDPATLRDVLVTNGYGEPAGGKIIFDSISNAGNGVYLT